MAYMRINRSLSVVSLFSLLILVGCNEASLMKLQTPSGAPAIASHYVDLLRDNQLDQIQREFDQSVVNDDTADNLATMRNHFPEGAPISQKVVGANVIHGNHPPITTVALEYEFPDDQWVIAKLDWANVNGKIDLLGFHVSNIPDSIEHSNRFTFAGKGFSQCFTLFLALLMVAINIHAFITCLRTPNIRLKWLWLIATLIGVGRFSVNWTTGQTFITPLFITVPAAQATALLYQPWIIAASFPIGAIAFYIMRERKTGHLFH